MDPYVTPFPTRRRRTEPDPVESFAATLGQNTQTTQPSALPGFYPAMVNATASGLNPAAATRYAVLQSQRESAIGQQAMLGALPPRTAEEFPGGGQTGTITYNGVTTQSTTPVQSSERQAAQANADRAGRVATLKARENSATDQMYGAGYRPAVDAMQGRLKNESEMVATEKALGSAKIAQGDKELALKGRGLDIESEANKGKLSIEQARVDAEKADSYRKDRLTEAGVTARTREADAAIAASDAQKTRFASPPPMSDDVRRQVDQLTKERNELRALADRLILKVPQAERQQFMNKSDRLGGELSKDMGTPAPAAPAVPPAAPAPVSAPAAAPAAAQAAKASTPSTPQLQRAKAMGGVGSGDFDTDTGILTITSADGRKVRFGPDGQLIK